MKTFVPAFNASLVLLCLMLSGCREPSGTKADASTLFQLLPAEKTGIDFINEVQDSKDLNIFRYRNFYNGGGVAIGDIDNDGRPDIFLTANMGGNKLYLNRGNWRFEDVTQKAGIKSTHHWHTGVTMADVNHDGWLDIYVCNSGEIPDDDRANELFINQGNGTFKEMAKEYGLDDRGESTQAVFFDYDHDGDLDCFVLNNSNRSVESFGYSVALREVRDPQNGDRLYRNDNGHFTDVSAAAGIYGSAIAYGLGITVGDLNGDGWEDIYVSNDFFERDYLYLNQKNGTFREVIDSAMGHTSQGSMGSDMADLNNDGRLDIFTTEMLPESDARLKTTIRFDNYDVVNAKNTLDYHHQFTSNCLQLNNGDGTFSEIAQLCGIDATGWSWGALGFDFDNDGNKDLLVCNGLQHDITDQDFLEFLGSEENMERTREKGVDLNEILKKMPSVPVVKYAFMNRGGFRFQNRADSLGLGTPAFSNGAAYGDLDGDGDLDLVINNVNSPAFVYRNRTTELLHRGFLKIRLAGEGGNRLGYGARVTLYGRGGIQVLEMMPSRGFQSSMNPELVFGLGQQAPADSLLIHWPSGKAQWLHGPWRDSTLVIEEKNAIVLPPDIQPAPARILTEEAQSKFLGASRHNENSYIDFNLESLIPKMLSTEGPKIAAGDVNGDGLEDIYIGGALGDTGKLFLRTRDGHFRRQPQPDFDRDRIFETVGCAFLDADGDGDLDLVAATGGNQQVDGSPLEASRLYLNDGKGNFRRATAGWPLVSVNASCVVTADFDGDGDPDIFIGARSIAGSYGVAPGSVLLRNEGKGVFTDVTAAVAPALLHLGMVTAAVWTDLDGDGKPDLAIAGDWMPITIFSRQGTQLVPRIIPNSSGWWNVLSVADVDGDHIPDLIAGNFGLNSRIKADSAHPARLYVGDFGGNGHSQCIPVYYKSDGKAYPWFMKGELQTEIPTLKKKFLRFSDYAGRPIEDLLGKEGLKKASILEVQETRTGIFFNDGKAKFHFSPLPVEAQFSPVFAIGPGDANNDGSTDLFLGGNLFGVKPQTGRFDASFGQLFLNRGMGHFAFSPSQESGLSVSGEIRDAVWISSPDRGKELLIAVNNDVPRLFKTATKK